MGINKISTLILAAACLAAVSFGKDQTIDKSKLADKDVEKARVEKVEQEKMSQHTPDPDTMTLGEMRKHCKEMMQEPKDISKEALNSKYSKLIEQIQAHELAKFKAAERTTEVRKMPEPDTLGVDALREHCKEMMRPAVDESKIKKEFGPHTQKGHKGMDK